MSPRAGLDYRTVLQSAAEIADEWGLEAVTLANLAKKLKVRPPSLYNHVSGLPGIRRALAIYGLERLHEVLFRACEAKVGDDAVRALAQAYVTFVREHPGQYEASLISPHTEDVELNRAQARIVELSLHVLHVYGLSQEGALHATRGLRSLCHGFASIERMGGFGLPLDLDISFRLLVDAFLAGMETIKSYGKS